MQKKSNDTKKQLRMLESVPAKDEDDEKENVVKVNSTRKRKRKKSSIFSAPLSTPTIKIKRSALRPIVKAVAEKMFLVSNAPRPVTVEDVARERDSLSTTLVRRVKSPLRKRRGRSLSLFSLRRRRQSVSKYGDAKKTTTTMRTSSAR